MFNRRIKALIFAVLWIVGLVLFICGLFSFEETLMTYGALLLILFGITKTIKFILGFIFDLVAPEEKDGDGFFLALFLNFLILLCFGLTGISLLMYPIIAIIEIVKDIIKTPYLTEEEVEREQELADNFYQKRKYTFAAIYGIILGVITMLNGQLFPTYIANIIEDEKFFVGNIGQFIFMFSLIAGIIVVILSIRIGYKWGAFTSGETPEYKKINVNGKNYYVKTYKSKK